MRLQFGELNISPRVEERLSELGYTVADLQEAVARHKSSCDGEPSVYVGTYGKYNDGSLCGLWIDLSSFNSYDDFIEFCKAIHADEEDPELMAQLRGLPPPVVQRGLYVGGRLRTYPRILGYVRQARSGGRR